MKAKQLKLTAWSSKKPQCVGEYNASGHRDSRIFRWWDGKHWSLPYAETDCDQLKRRCRRLRSHMSQARIEWRGLVKKPHYPFPPGPLGSL